MNSENLSKIYLDLNQEISKIEESLNQIEQKGKGIPFIEKNVRAIKALLYAFKSGLMDDFEDTAK